MDPRMEPRRQELGTMGPPPAVAHPSNNKADAPPLPASSKAKTAAPTRRIIKTINLDFNKLKEAGLDRKLAEVLSKQNPGPRAGIRSSSSSSSSSVAMQSSSASTSTATATATLAAAASTSLHSQQQQQLHQPALPQPLVKRIQISEYVEKTIPIHPPPLPTSPATLERSMHVKSMLKNRILNKSIGTSPKAQQKPLAAPKTPPAAAQGSAPRSAGTSTASPEALSIPKADVRPKHPPLLLNLVNQLPKNRDTCISNEKLLRNQQEQLQQRAFEKQPPPLKPHISRQQSFQDPQHIPEQIPPQPPPQLAAPEVPIVFQKSPSPPLIVLENKVLAPNEKIDLSDLRLPSNTTKVATILTTKSQPPAKTINKGKVIMNPSKFKVSREKLAEMAKEIRNQAKQVKLSTQADSTLTIKTPMNIPSVREPKPQPSYTVEATKLTSLEAKELPNSTPAVPVPVNNASDNINNNAAAPLDQKEQDETTESSFVDFPSHIPEPEQLPKPVTSTETSFLDLPIHVSTKSEPKQLNISSNPEPKQLTAAVKPTKEIPGEVVTTEPQERGVESSEVSPTVPKVQSAVDFIAQLTAEHSLDESSFMELSPEEQRLNALFGGSGGGSFTGMSPQKSEKELPKEQSINTLVEGGSSTARTPSKKQPEEPPKPAEEELPIGKIMKMDDMDILHATLDVNSDSTNILRISPNAIKLRSSVVALELPEVTTTEVSIVANTTESLVVATPIESPKDEQPPKPAAEESSKPVPDPEPAKEANPPAKRVPLRSKKAKINLVQRTKRPSIPSKLVEAKKTKLDEDEEAASASLIGHSLLDEDQDVGAKAIEVPAVEEQEVRECKEDEKQGAIESKDQKEQGARVSTEDAKQGARESKEDEQQEAIEYKDHKEQDARVSTEDKKRGARDSTEYEKQGVRESTADEQQEGRESKEQEQEPKDPTEDEPKEASSPAKETKTNSQADNKNSAKSTIERDLTQLYHPPKMPKTKPSKKNSNQEALEESQLAAAPSNKVSLIEILSQEQPPPQGDAKLPFRKESTEVYPPESTGIQSLITLLTAEKVSPLQTKKKSSPTLAPNSEESTKTMPRKKRVKTRPVLSKRPSRKQDEMATNSLEFLHPISANVGGGRIPTSSTSDDDGTMFLGFDNKEEKRSKTPVRGKRVRQMKINETDISDDATPDYDETEEEQQPAEQQKPNRHKPKAYDSDSSDYPMDFADNSTIEDTSCDKTLVAAEAVSSDKVNWEDFRKKSKEIPSLDENLSSQVLEHILDTTIVAENEQQETPNKEEKSEPVISENDSSFNDKKSRRSRKKSRKPSPEKEVETPAIEMISEEPTTSRRATRTSRAQAKLQSKAESPEPLTSKETLNSFQDSEKSNLIPTTQEDKDTSKPLDTPDILVSKENQKEVDKSKTSVKRKGRSRCITPTIRVTLANEPKTCSEIETNALNADSKQKEDESKVLEKPKEDTVAKEIRQTRILSVSEPEPVINKGSEEQPIESTTSVKSTGTRASRSKAKQVSPAPAAAPKLAETSTAPQEPIEAVKLVTRKSRSKTPKIPLQPVAETTKITKSEESNTDTRLQRDSEEVKAAEEPNHSKISGRTQNKRSSRSRKSTGVPPVAKEDIKLDEKPQNIDLKQQQEEVKAAEELEHSVNSSVPTKPKRQSRSKTPKIPDSVVTKDRKVGNRITSRLGSQEEQDQGVTTEVTNASKPATENEAAPVSSIKSKRKRLSRNTPKSVSTIVPAEDEATIAESQPAETVASRGKRKTPSRLSSVPPDTEAAPTPAPKDSAPKRGRKSSAATQVQNPSETSVTGGEDEPKVAAPATAAAPTPAPKDSAPKRGRKSSAAKQAQNPSEASVTGGEDGPKVAAPATAKRGRKQAAPLADAEACEAPKKLKTVIKTEPGEAPAFNPRLLLIRQREQLDSEEVLTEEGQGKGPLQCGLCLARSTEKEWQNHLGQHYGVGWLVGETPEVTRSWALRMMKKYLESGKKLKCRLCQQQLGSNSGMLIHLECCGNKQRFECDLCKKSYAKLSIAAHRQSCLGQQRKREENACAFNLRLLLIRKREQLESEEVLTEEDKGQGPLQCGLCLARSNEQMWQTHLGEHYGVGWLVGETPTNITRNWVIIMMKGYLASSHKLICRLCNRQLGSALGMMLHLENCGHKQRVECKICHKSYTVLTLPSHLRTCTKRLQLDETSTVKAEHADEEAASEAVYSNAGRTKRKSTIKAETKLKKIGEVLSTQAPEETNLKHEFDASDTSDYDMEKDKESSEEYDSEGVDSNEDSIKTDQEGSDGDQSKRSKKQIHIKRPANISEHATKPLFLRDQNPEARSTKWKEFLQLSYSKTPLYSQLVASYSMLPPEEAKRLLPSKDTTSVRYAYGKVSEDSDWKRLTPHEGFNKKGEYLGYLGGSIKQLAWVPLPPKVTDQYLLCSIRPKMKAYARHSKLKQEDALLMLLKCTEESSQKSWSVRPELHYGIRVPNGPVHSFAFLPSGGYDQTSNRLGLLAVANASSDVHIYALPLELKDEERCEEKVVIQLDAVITLSFDVDQSPADDQCTKICWSEASGHNFLATGYASGRIAFWDIDDTEGINCFGRNNHQAYVFVPLNTFFFGERNIQFMELHYDMNGPRWLAVGTLIRRFMIYDIMNWSQPTPLKHKTINSLYLVTMTWSPICEAIVLSNYPNYSSRAILLNPAGVEFDHRTLDNTLTASRAMHTNCPQDHMVLVTDLGDLAFLDVKDLSTATLLSKTMLKHRAVSTTKLHHLGAKEPSPKESISVDEFLRDYGVQINPVADAKPQALRNCKYLANKRRPSNPHSHSLTRVNCVRCNWNTAAHTWVATGAEHGLLRILNFKRNKFF